MTNTLSAEEMLARINVLDQKEGSTPRESAQYEQQRSWREAQASVQGSPLMQNTYNAPAHYLTTTGGDTYDMLCSLFGAEALKQHMIMECLQYLVRYQKKGTPMEDLNKVITICQRLVRMEATT